MKKWTFWITMCVVSILNGGFFFGASASAMNRGLDGIDNQAAFLFIPLLWVIAVLALIAINIYTLIQGSKIERNYIIDFFEIFQKLKRSFLLITCLLMILGYSLFAEEMIWAVSYSLSGGLLLMLLYIWKLTSGNHGRFAS